MSFLDQDSTGVEQESGNLNDVDMEEKAGLSHRRVNNTKDNSPG